MNKRIAFKLSLTIALLISVCLLLLCGCKDNIQKYTLSENVVSSKADAALSVSNMKLNEKMLVATDGNLSLYYSDKTGCVAVKNSSDGKVWYALPEKANKSASLSPSILSLDVLVEGTQYRLSSQTDALKNNAVQKSIDNGILALTYSFTVTHSENESSVITVPVKFFLLQGNFYCTVDCDSITVSNEKAIITKLYLMNFFGATTENEVTDFYLFPDNCGGAYYPARGGKKVGDRSVRVYGDENENNCILGAYGAKIGTDAFVGLIEDGDSIATVNLFTKEQSGYNSVGACFDICEAMISSGEKKSYIYTSQKQYDGQIKLCYRFLSGNSSTYSSMAISCREKLIRNGMISADSLSVSDGLPFVLSVLAVDNTTKQKQQLLTTYEQLQDMLTYLKGKGFSMIYINCKGTLTGGTDQVNITNANTIEGLGTALEYKELTDYITAQQMKLFISLSGISGAGGTLGSGRLASRLDGTTLTTEAVNTFSNTSKKSFCNQKSISKNIISLFDFANEHNISNLNLNDTACMLYGDGLNGSTRNDIMDEIRTETSSINTLGTLMVEHGNFYAIKNADIINSIPLEAQNTSYRYISVPFVQMILHGTIEYSSEPINYAEDYQVSMLKAIEYGAMPQFEWCYEKTSEDEKDIHSYSEWATIAYNYYEKANKALGDLMGRRITSHKLVKKGVYCTSYDDTLIYVNYTDKPITIKGVIVPAMDFMRIN